MNPCVICGTKDPEKPMCFRGERWCCDDHRKLLHNEWVPRDGHDLAARFMRST